MVAAAQGDWRSPIIWYVRVWVASLRADSTGALVTLYPWTVVALNEQRVILARRATRSVFRGLTNRGDGVPI